MAGGRGRRRQHQGGSARPRSLRRGSASLPHGPSPRLAQARRAPGRRGRLGPAPVRGDPAGSVAWGAATPPLAPMHLPPARPGAAGRRVTPASACLRAGHRLRGSGQEPGDVPRAADPRDHVQVSGGAAGTASAPAAPTEDARRAPPPRPTSGRASIEMQSARGRARPPRSPFSFPPVMTISAAGCSAERINKLAVSLRCTQK